ncbi:MAG: DarT ssDNA thymidine ADP-ribosyltransferase family protein [Terrimesophilobacter sp.]
MPAKPTRARPQRSTRVSSSTKEVAVDTGTRRIFHLTHVKNLEAILTQKQILSDAAGANPLIDISSPDNRELRRELKAGAASVASYVPFFLAPDALLWEGMRSGVANYRLANNAERIPASEFVMLVGSVSGAGSDSMITDGDAADPATQFSSPDQLGGRMPRRFFEEEDSIRSAEFLVPGAFPLTSITLIGVANDKVRAQVRAMVSAHGFTHKVSVYPPWFQSS